MSGAVQRRERRARFFGEPGRIALLGSAGAETLFAEAKQARWFFPKLVGLLLCRELGEEEALWIAGCREVHSIGMRMEIDVVFLDAESHVIEVDRLRPNRILGCRGAASVIECQAGLAEKKGIAKRLRLQFGKGIF